MSTYIRRQEVSHAIGRHGRFVLRLTDADVQLTATDGDLAEVVASFELSAGSDAEATSLFERVRLQVVEGSGALTLEQPEETPGPALLNLLTRGRARAELRLEARLPRMAEVRVETVSGDIGATGLEGEQRYTVVSGDLVVLDVAGSVRLSSVSGDAVVRSTTGVSLRAESVSGDMGISAPRFAALRLSSVSGDIDAEGALQPGGEFRMETVSGDVSFGPIGPATFEVRGLSTDISSDIDHRVEGRADRRQIIVGRDGPQLVFSSMSGDFHVRRPRHVEQDVVWAVSAGSDGSARRAETTAQRAGDLDVLRALERGDIDIDEAARRLADR
jgi:hypothetical protein